MNDIELLADLPVKVDYLLLSHHFSQYKNVKKKIFDLKKKSYLLQIKRGQYLNLKSKFIESTSLEVLANSFYYPSYISLEWALQYYGLLMDRVVSVTSVTLLRSTKIKTPYAVYTYTHITKNRYPIGYINKSDKTGESILIAMPEKAVIDYVNLNAKNLVVKKDDDILEFFEEDLRLNLSEFLKMSKLENLQELLPFYHRNSKEHRILKWLMKQKGGSL